MGGETSVGKKWTLRDLKKGRMVKREPRKKLPRVPIVIAA